MTRCYPRSVAFPEKMRTEIATIGLADQDGQDSQGDSLEDVCSMVGGGIKI